MKCPECGGNLWDKEIIPISYKNKLLEISVWTCLYCGHTEEVEPDWDSMKNGPDHE